MVELGWKSVGLIELTALPSIDKERWVPLVRKADVLLVSGGDALYLCHWMRECGLTDLLPELDAHLVRDALGDAHRGDAARRRLHRIERLPLHREYGLKAGIADAGHGQGRRFPLDDKQFRPRATAMDLAVDKLDRAVVEGF